MSARLRLQKFLCKTASCCQLNQKSALVTASSQHNTDNQLNAGEVQKIVIPTRIKRGPTDILEALSSTVGKDYTAASYKYIDDPYLTPTSGLSKRIYSLSKSSGRKTARYMLQKYPQNFAHNPAIPHVPAFAASQVVNYSEVPTNETTLLNCIEQRRVIDAIDVHKQMTEDGAHLSSSTMQQLLDLLCIYNSENPTPQLCDEEQYYSRDITGTSDNRKPIRNTWKENSLSEKIFADLAEKTLESYYAMIQGTAKYLNTEMAFKLYNEMCDKKLPVSLETYNSLLQVAVYHGDTYQMKWELINNLLKDIKKANLQPTLDTFNAVLMSLSRMTRYRKCREIAQQVLREMKNCDIEPSLGSWSMFLNICYPNDHVESTIIYDIINHLHGREFTLQHSADVDFFSNAMAKCFIQIKNPELGYKIDELLNTGMNYKLMGDAFKEGIYYSFFFRLICQFEPMDKIIEYYDKFTPNIWTPNTLALVDLLKAVELHDGQEYLLRIWSDLMLFELTRREDILNSVFELMTKENKPELVSQFAEIAANITQRWTEEVEQQSRPFFLLTGEILGNLIIISLKADHFKQAWSMLEVYTKNSRDLSNLLSENSLLMLLMHCVQRKLTTETLHCAEVIANLGYVIPKERRNQIKEELQLSEMQSHHLESLSS